MFKTTNIQPITKDLLETVKQAVKEQNENKHYETAIIIDLETLGRTNDAVVFNLAALFFSLNPDEQESLEQEEPNNSLNLRFDVLEQIALGNKLDFSTAEFWSNTKNKLALETITKLPLSNFKESMEELNKWVRNLKVKYGCRVHHRGMDFDGPILDNLYKAAGIKKEWIRGDATRDIRSYIDALLKTNTGYVPGISKESIEITHTALGDCYNDARAMQIAYKLNKDNTCDNEFVAAATIMHDLELKFKEFESIVTTLLLFRGINEIGPHIKDKDISYVLTDRNEDSFTIHAKHDNGKTVEVIIEHG